MRTAKAKLRYLRISPKKVRLVADLIRGMPVNRALAQLYLLPNRAAKPLFKLLNSAIANAQNKNLAKEKLFISEIRVDQGPSLKRYRFEARGRVHLIKKKSTHVSLCLAEAEKPFPQQFSFPEKEKKKEKKVAKKEEKEKVEEEKTKLTKAEEKVEPKKERKGGITKIFRRKAT